MAEVLILCAVLSSGYVAICHEFVLEKTHLGNEKLLQRLFSTSRICLAVLEETLNF